MSRLTDAGLVGSAGVLGSASLLHFGWAMGARLGTGAVIPTVGGAPVLRPTRRATVAVACVLALGSLAFVGVALSWKPGWLFRAVTAVGAGVLLLRSIGDGRTVGFTKRVKGTRFATLDSRILSPLCLALSVAGFAGVAL